MKKHYLTICLLWVSISISWSQTSPSPVSNLYTNNPYILNPARAGNYLGMIGYAQYKSQFSSLDGAPRIINAGFHTPFNNFSGLGIRLQNETKGIFENFSLDGSYAHAIRLSPGQGLLLGVSLGIQNRQLDLDGLALDPSNDPVLNSSTYEETNFIVGTGITYINNDFELDVVLPRLLEQEEGFSQHIIALASYEFKIQANNLAIKPSVLYQNLPYSNNQFDVNVMATYNNTIWLQPTYRSNNSFLAMLGYSYKYMDISYSCQLYQGELAEISRFSHEVGIYIKLINKKASNIVRQRDWLLKHKNDRFKRRL